LKNAKREKMSPIRSTNKKKKRKEEPEELDTKTDKEVLNWEMSLNLKV
jgi:hypothetical protein